jgi:hypothetical protein
MMKVNFTPNFPQFSTAFHSHLVYTADVTETAEKSEFCTMLYAAERSGLRADFVSGFSPPGQALLLKSCKFR